MWFVVIGSATMIVLTIGYVGYLIMGEMADQTSTTVAVI